MSAGREGAELTKRFRKVLLARFPEWRRFATITRASGNEVPVLELAVPQEGTDRFLRLSTANNEITIQFDRWHTHLGTFLGIGIAECVETAVQMIEDFVWEERLVEIIYRGDVWCSSGLYYRVAPSPPEPHATTKIYSWRRTYDQIVETP